jgi:hypothetical protein
MTAAHGVRRRVPRHGTGLRARRPDGRYGERASKDSGTTTRGRVSAPLSGHARVRHDRVDALEGYGNWLCKSWDLRQVKAGGWEGLPSKISLPPLPNSVPSTAGCHAREPGRQDIPDAGRGVAPPAGALRLSPSPGCMPARHRLWSVRA